MREGEKTSQRDTAEYMRANKKQSVIAIINFLHNNHRAQHSLVGYCSHTEECHVLLSMFTRSACATSLLSLRFLSVNQLEKLRWE